MASIVASAAPATSIPSPATNSRSSAIFTTQETSRKSRDALLSPTPSKYPHSYYSPCFPVSDKNNADIRVGKVPGIRRHLHDFQHKRPGKLPDHRQRNGAYV